MGTPDDAFANTVATPPLDPDRTVEHDGTPNDERPIPELLGGRYRAKGRLGAGGFGVVYEAVDERLQKRVAVKVLSERNCRDENHFERFRAEAMAAGRLAHPNIVAVTDFDVLEDGRPFLVMELVEGEPLDALIAAKHTLPIPTAARIAQQLAQALSAAHEHGIIHRDLKPANVIVAEDSKQTGDGAATLKILDFGVAKLVEGSEPRQLTHTGQTLGTPTYMAPEQVRRRGELDGRADVYSVGIILYELLTGTTPFAGRAAGDIMVSKVIEKPKPPSKHNSDIPTALERIILRAIQPDRDDRYESAAALAEVLEPFTREETNITTGAKDTAHMRWLVLALALLAAIALAAFLLMRGRSQRSETARPADETPAAQAASVPAPAPSTTADAAPVAVSPPEAEPHASPDAGAEPPHAAEPPAKPKKKPTAKRKPRRKPKREPSDLPDSPIEKIRVPR